MNKVRMLLTKRDLAFLFSIKLRAFNTITSDISK